MNIFRDEYMTYSDNLLTLKTEPTAIMNFAVRDAIRFVDDESYIVDEVAYVTDLNDYALKSDIPSIPENLVNTDTLTSTLNNYPTLDETNEALEVLKNRIETLENENILLKETIASLKPTYMWQNYYTGFDERVEFVGYMGVDKAARCIIGSERTKLTFSYVASAFNPNKQYLFILIDNVGDTHYFRFDIAANTVYFDEIFGDTQSVSYPEGGSFTIKTALDQTLSPDMPFKYVFVKSVTSTS